MKLRRLTVANIRSFASETSIEFNDDFTILIGPNGGGKSNVLDIVTIAMRQYLFPPYGITREQDANGTYYVLRTENPFGNIHAELAKHYGAAAPSYIAFDFELQASDVESVATVLGHDAEVHENANRFRNGRDGLETLSEVRKQTFARGDRLKFEIKDGQFVRPTDPKVQAFFQYLRIFNRLAILLEDGPHRLATPFVHFPPYRGAPPDGLNMSLASRSRWDIEIGHARATSRNPYSLIPLATFHFASKHRALEVGARSAGYSQLFKSDSEVKQVTDTLESLGYEWDLTLKDPLQNTYEINLRREGQQFDISSASSGEKELINFIFGVFALNVRDGLVIIDEPELHLHPRWQQLLYGMFEQLQKATGNQFILATHSASFITPKTLGKMARVARKDRHSEITKLDASGLAGNRELLQMINSHNNERLFFADIVVLVEGIQDRVLFEKLLGDEIEKRRADRTIPVRIPVVEVLEVHGKANLQRYRELLDAAGISHFSVADRDYAEQIGNAEIKVLFNPDPAKAIGKSVLNPKSTDRIAMANAIDAAIAAGNIAEVKKTWDYILSRSSKFRSEITPEEQKMFDAWIAKQRQEQRIAVLKRGAIEAYLPEGHTSLERTVQLVAADDFAQQMKEKQEHYAELLDICAAILASGQSACSAPIESQPPSSIAALAPASATAQS